MPRLILMRHAKSSWADSGLPDHNRPLSARGEKAATTMAEVMIAQGLRPSGILCSTALRARRTLFPLLERMEGDVRICFSNALYHASGPDYLELIQTYGEKLAGPEGPLLLLGHNFAIQEAALILTHDKTQHKRKDLEMKFPTGGIAVLQSLLRFADWAPQTAILIEFFCPRNQESQ